VEYVACNLCGSRDFEQVYPGTLNGERPKVEAYRCTNFGYGLHHPIVRCRNCGLIFANPRYSADELLDEYVAVEDPLYEQERQGRVLTFERHLQPIEKMMGGPQGKRLLDVGCYTGIFLEIAEKHGWESYGIEPSQWAAQLCKERGLKVYNGTLEQANFPDNHFDVATSWDVIEHLNDPVAHLAEIHRVLKPGGLLACHTIDIDAPFAKLMGPRWPWLMEMHLYYFSRTSLAAMMKKVGFEIVDAQAQGRYQRLSYLVSRIQAVSTPLYRVADAAIRGLGLEAIAVPINLGDLVTTYARK
jgi:ubiquinone/menaquinone biosynthesis C-methylase UbiE